MLTDEQRHEVAGLVRAGMEIIAMGKVREGNQLSLRDAKAIVIHITQEPERCHRCKQPLEGAPVSLCPSCRALDYDWWEV
jgi:tRNA(Ile2) C34 agmatinyltransferase TiaS